MTAEPRTCDVAVIGAGINGAGIARDAALRGLKRGVASLCLGGGEATAMAIEID